MFVDVQIYAGPDGEIFADILDGLRILAVVFGQGDTPERDARERAIVWARENGRLIAGDVLRDVA